MNAAQKTHLRLLGSLNRHKRFRFAAMTAYRDLLKAHNEMISTIANGVPLTPDLVQSAHAEARASYDEMIRIHEELEEE
jgi:hypothetical protein